jgi:hypothetical protein
VGRAGDGEGSDGQHDKCADHWLRSMMAQTTSAIKGAAKK